jgi:uncharacterized damage-inducible protein DinB
MNYYGAAELAAAFRTVCANTLKAAEEIPEDKYGFSAASGSMTIQQVLTHIALSYKFQFQVHSVEKRNTLVGMDFPALFQKLGAEQAQPRTKAEILDLLRNEGEVWAGFLAGVSESFLAESVGMPEGATPATKSRFEMLLSVKEHEMHHRAQLMMMQRMLGITPHLTRDMQARMAQMQQAQSSKA